MRALRSMASAEPAREQRRDGEECVGNPHVVLRELGLAARIALPPQPGYRSRPDLRLLLTD